MTAVQKQNESDFCRCDYSASCPSKCVLPLTLAPAIHVFGLATEELRVVAGGVAEEDVRQEEVSAMVSACCLPLDTAW